MCIIIAIDSRRDNVLFAAQVGQHTRVDLPERHVVAVVAVVVNSITREIVVAVTAAQVHVSVCAICSRHAKQIAIIVIYDLNRLLFGGKGQRIRLNMQISVMFERFC